MPDGFDNRTNPHIEGLTPIPAVIERRGLDAAVIALIKQLHEQFVEAHAHVHETFVDSHEREHNLRLNATNEALQLAAEQLRSEIQHVREYYDGILRERNDRHEARFQASETAILTALEAREKAVQAALDAKDKLVQAAFESSEKAIGKSESSMEKRADATYVSLAELQRNLGQLMPRGEAEQRFNGMNTTTDDLRDRVKGLESLKVGGREAISNVQMFIGIVLAMLTIAGLLFATQTGG